MRFSSLFHQPASPVPAGEVGVRGPAPKEASQPAAPAELPEDLDARVRLLGEWQLLEG